MTQNHVTIHKRVWSSITSLVALLLLATGIILIAFFWYVLSQEQKKRLTLQSNYELFLIESRLEEKVYEIQKMIDGLELIDSFVQTSPEDQSIESNTITNLDLVENAIIIHSNKSIVFDSYSSPQSDGGIDRILKAAPSNNAKPRALNIHSIKNNTWISFPLEYYGSRQGSVLIEFKTDTFFRNHLSKRKLPLGEIIVKITHKNSAKALYSRDHQANDYFGTIAEKASGSFLQEAGYSLEALFPRSTFSKTLRISIVLLITIVALSLVVALYSSNAIANRISRPVLLLAKKVATNNSKDNTNCYPIGTNDELEDLAKAFDEKSSELKEYSDNLESKVQQRTSQLEKALQTRTQFLANMSHEIRTPLNGIIGITENLIDDNKDKKLNNKLKILRNSGTALISVINNILDFSKLEKDAVELEAIDFSPKALLSEKNTLFESQARSLGLEFFTEIDPSCDSYLKGDQAKISQIIYNLVSNSLKFTQKGSIKICGRVDEMGEKRKLIIKVIDTGIGIPSHRAHKLFQPFQQADNSITRRFGGTGLGLSICKQLAELMEGCIRHRENPESTGSIFELAIPLNPGKKPAKRKSSTEISELIDKEIAIMIAEDNAVNQIVARNHMKRLGFKSILVVNNGQEACRKANEKDFSLILMDMQMPIMDGVEAARRITTNEKSPKPIIIPMTANVLPEHRALCASAGMVGFLGKPLKREVIAKEINRVWLQKHHERSA